MALIMHQPIDCQMAFVTWATRAMFRQGKLGLLRGKDNRVYLALFFKNNEYYKILVDRQSLTLLPAAIRSEELQRDLFVRDVSEKDIEVHKQMIRAIRVLLNCNEVRRLGKGDKLDRLIASLPSGDLANWRIPDCAWPARAITKLDLSGLEQTVDFKFIETLSRSLEDLDISNSSINKLPRTFCCKMNKLRHLNLSHNLIETLPLEIKFFSKLVTLNLSHNRLRLLPTTFSDLRALRVLNVSGNNLSQLPAFRRADIPNLETLDISSNPLDGALRHERSTFEVYPSHDCHLGYEETSFSKLQVPKPSNKDKVPKLFEISLLKIVRCDKLFKRASREALPQSIVSTMQRDIFKCYQCSQMNMLPAYNSTDYLEYVAHVTNLLSTGNYSHGMTFMKLLCKDCFGKMNHL